MIWYSWRAKYSNGSKIESSSTFNKAGFALDAAINYSKSDVSCGTVQGADLIEITIYSIGKP